LSAGRQPSPDPPGRRLRARAQPAEVCRWL